MVNLRDGEDSEGEENETIWLQNFEFNMERVPCPTILLVGKRFSGKSYTSVSIAEKFKVPRFCAFCGTKDTEDFWAEKFESSASVRGPDDAGKSYLITVIKYQQRKARLYKKVLKKPFPMQYMIGMIFDDITSKREFRKGEMLEDLFSNGRHYKAVIIISCQYLKQLPPAVRTNADYMFLMHNTKRTCKVLYEDYVEEPSTFGEFLQLLRSVTGQTDDLGNNLFNSLVYDNSTTSSKLEDMFKVYRNEGEAAIDNMKLGSEEWREYNKTHYRDKDHESQMREYRKRKRLLRIQEYRQRQMERRQNPGAFISNDLDYFSDSDSEDEQQTHDTIMLGKKKGPKTTVNFSRKTKEQTERSNVDSQVTGYSIPDNQAIPSAPGYERYGAAPPLLPESRPYGYAQESRPSYGYGYDSRPPHYEYGYESRPWDTRNPQENRGYPGVNPQGSYPGVNPQGSYPGLNPHGSYPGVNPQGSYPGVNPQGSYGTTSYDYNANHHRVSHNQHLSNYPRTSNYPDADTESPLLSSAERQKLISQNSRYIPMTAESRSYV